MNQRYIKIKRIQDIMLSLIVLIILSPFLLFISILIFIDDPHGSPIYSQIRVGENGKLFIMYKFRSMYMNAEERMEELYHYNEMDGPAFKMQDDPRITRIGKVIRRTCIDEMPQFVNVLKGDMSLVGPRPALPSEVACYDSYQRKRLEVLPGMTCYWQIQPYRHKIPFKKWIELDLKYIQEQSILTDWKILFKTLGVLYEKDN